MKNQNHLDWAWPAFDLPTTDGTFSVTGLVVPYDALAWLARKGGVKKWFGLNPAPDALFPLPGPLFEEADVILASGRPWDAVSPGEVSGLDPLTVTGEEDDDAVVYGREAFERLIAGSPDAGRLKVLVVAVDREYGELYRLASWVKHLRGEQDAYPDHELDFSGSTPWTWDKDAGARE